MALPTVTMTGNLTADPELRFTPSGHAVASFVVATTERRLDRDTNEWKDGDSCFLRCSVWRQAAENFAESARKGTSVTVVGTLRQRTYEKDGQTFYVIEMAQVYSVSIAITANQVAKVEKLRSGPPAGATAAPDDPWAHTSAGSTAPQDQYTDEPPF